MFYERLYFIIFQQKEKKCQESCFSGTSGNSGGDGGGDGEANSIPRGMGSPGSPWHPYLHCIQLFLFSDLYLGSWNPLSVTHV
jgi:hypothetical protein